MMTRNQTITTTASPIWHAAIEFSQSESPSTSRDLSRFYSASHSHSHSHSHSEVVSSRSSVTYAPPHEPSQESLPPLLHHGSSYVPSSPVPVLVDGRQRRHSAYLASHPHPYNPLPASIPCPVNHTLDSATVRTRALSTSAVLPPRSAHPARVLENNHQCGAKKWFYGPAPYSFGGPECPLTRTLTNPRTRLEREISKDERDIQMYGGDAIRDPPLRSPHSLIHTTVSEALSEDGTVRSEQVLESETRDVAVAAAATTDTNLVGWDGPDDPENPQNWSVKYKWIVTGICILMTVNVCVSTSPFYICILIVMK